MAGCSAGGKLIALEDVTIDDLGGTQPFRQWPHRQYRGQAPGRGPRHRRWPRPHRPGDGAQAQPAASVLDRRVHRSAPPRSLPASADVVVSFGDIRRLTLDGKLGGTVTQVSADLSGPLDKPMADVKLKADSLDAAGLMRQLGLTPAAALDSGPRLARGHDGGPARRGATLEPQICRRRRRLVRRRQAHWRSCHPAFDGRLAAKTSDAMTPAQLFGITIPGSQPGDGAEIDTGFRWRGGRLVLDDLPAWRSACPCPAP